MIDATQTACLATLVMTIVIFVTTLWMLFKLKTQKSVCSAQGMQLSMVPPPQTVASPSA